ncbi:6387_t:CDS:2 [Paraglomus brasilianum]|uniref:6387_t:CDS:1 n=1 Tax=Paraglomus brasilianum TaxID=144538 RepID=A0A9N9DI57_9GLOM|nr:6387_t:CDS:2 [Paraglomus brasilianum]
MDNFQEITFNKDPATELRYSAWLLEPPMGVTLGMTVEELLAPGRRSKSKPTPPRPQEPHILFGKNFRALHRMEFIYGSKRSMNEWKNALPVVKEYFEMLSKEAKKRHAIKYPNYKYKPQPRRNVDGSKRRRRQRFPNVNPPETPQHSPKIYIDPMTTGTDQFIYLSDIIPTFPATGQSIKSSPASTTTPEEFVTQDDDGLSLYFDYEYYTNDDVASCYPTAEFFKQ